MDSQGRGKSFVRKPRRPGGARPEEPGIAPEAADEQSPPAAPAPSRPGPASPPETRSRVVIPRQERDRKASGLDVELREVRWGTTSRGAYLRVVPSQQRLKRTSLGHIAATRAGSTPTEGIERIVQTIKGAVFGPPLAMAHLAHERLSKLKALAILGSDPLSSSAYATEEALLILALAGTAGLVYLMPIGAVVAVLLVLVTVSYRQTIRAYPDGGGAYAVSHDNLGMFPGLIAAGALMVDYTLLVSVSVAAGVAAITSALPDLADYRVPMSVFVVIAFVWGNLRGIRESGSIFAAPTYFFIVMMFATVIFGVVRVLIGDAPGTLTEAAPPDHPERLEELATGGVTLWLVLRAFSSGASALTGVEAMANGVPSFKQPEADNARTTMVWMAAIGVFLFLGITFLSSRFGLVPTHDETLVSDMGRTILGDNPLYFMFQAATAMILFLAANTSFNAFPLLGAILAKDRYLPRQFGFRGDRLAFSNGIIVLAVIAVALLIIYDAQVTRLIPLYAVGVFVAFTLSQAGMVKRWWLRRGAGWGWSLAMNGVGMVATGIVAVIITATKFTAGAWIAMLMMAVLVVMFALIRRHYGWYERIIAVDPEHLTQHVPTAAPLEAPRDHIVIPVDDVNQITLGAADMARALSTNITAVHLTDDAESGEAFHDRWEQIAPDIPLLIIDSPYRAFAPPMLAYVELLRKNEPDMRITVILPGFKARHWWERLLHNQAIRRLRPFLDDDPSIRIVEFDYDPRADSTPA